MSENRRIHLRIGTAAEWTTHNPVLALGEPGYISDSRILRIGDGVTAFDSLPDFNIPDDYIVPVLQGGTGSDNAIDARAALGLGTMAEQSAGAVAITGGTIDLQDNQKIRLGTGNDFEILHDGSNSYLREVGTGGLIIGGSTITFVSQNLAETLATLVQNGAVSLYYDSVKKFETTSTGVSVTGDLSADTLTPVAMGASTITMAAPQASTSGTSLDFTGIPAWANRVSILFNGVSVSGTDKFLLQIGDSGGIETTGYLGAAYTAASFYQYRTDGFPLCALNLAANVWNGKITLDRISGNTWLISGNIGDTANSYVGIPSGSKTLSATLDRVRITTFGGADTLDAGTINVTWE